MAGQFGHLGLLPGLAASFAQFRHLVRCGVLLGPQFMSLFGALDAYYGVGRFELRLESVELGAPLFQLRARRVRTALLNFLD